MPIDIAAFQVRTILHETFKLRARIFSSSIDNIWNAQDMYVVVVAIKTALELMFDKPALLLDPDFNLLEDFKTAELR